MQNLIFVKWQNLKMFAVPPKDRYRLYISVPAFWQNWEAACCAYHHRQCLRTILAFFAATLSGLVISCARPRLRSLLLCLSSVPTRPQSAAWMKQLKNIVVYGVSDLFLPARLRALTGDSCICANKEVLLPLPCKMRANILNLRLLRISRNCAVDRVADVLALARAGKID